MVYAEPCTCVGPTLRFERGSCFTCGRLLAHEVGLPEQFFVDVGYRALARAVDRTEQKVHAQARRMGYEIGSEEYAEWLAYRLEHPDARGPMPRRKRRRVVIERGGPSRALQAVRGAVGVC